MLDVSEKVKGLFRDGFNRKGIRIHFPNNEREDIVTKDIYGNGTSFVFTESLCSQSNLKFGLSEASMLEFDTIDVENIKGCTIEPYCEVTDPDTGETVSIPYGRFTVDSCKKQSNMRLRKVVAYSNTDLAVSPLTLAKLSLPSLNDYTYRIDIDDLVGSGDRTRERFTGAGEHTKIEFTCSTQGVDFDTMSFDTAYEWEGEGRYTIHCSMEYKYRKVGMMSPTFTPLNRQLWYDVRSEFDSAAISEWENGIRDISGYLDELKELAVYQKEADRQNLETFFQQCDAYLGGYTVRLEVLQTYKKKKLQTKKDIKLVMDDIENGVRRSRFVSSTYLDLLNARAGTATSGNGQLLADTLAVSSLTFMCPYSIDFDVVRQTGDSAAENVFHRSVVTDRKDYLIGYGEMNDRYAMSYPMKYPNDFFDPVLKPKPFVPMPYVQFERTQGTDGYFYCTTAETDLQKAIGSIAEIQAKFVHVDRYGVYGLVGISENFGMGLYPAEDLFPSEDLFPEDNNGVVASYDHRSLWYEDYEVQPFGMVVVNYKNKSGNDEILRYRFNPANRNIYHMKDNFIFKTGGWEPAQIRDILNTFFIPALSGIRYVPVELEMQGLPYIEAGDVLTVETRGGSLDAFVFRRTLKGINHMVDSIEARGDEVNESDIDESVTVVEETAE